MRAVSEGGRGMSTYREEGTWTTVRESGAGSDLTGPLPAAPNPVPSTRPASTGSRFHPRRVLLLGGDSDWNLGDQAIQSAVCHGLSQADPDVRITITSDLPRDAITARQLPNVVGAVPLRPSGIGALLASAAEQDLVLLSGGGLFQDDDSRVKMPYWALRLALLRRACPRIRGLSVGAGPLERRESRYWSRRAEASMDALSVRDPFAAAWMERCLGRQVPLVPDPAFLMEPAPRWRADALLRGHGIHPDTPLIGVAMRRWFHPRGGFLPHRWRFRLGIGDPGLSPVMLRCLDQLAGALRQLSDELGAQVVFLPTYPLPDEGDVAVCEALASRQPEEQRRVLILRDPALYKAVAGRLKLMISGRMHPLILAAGMGVPGVGLAYNGKFNGLYKMFGIAPRVVPLERFRDGEGGQAVVTKARDALVRDGDLADRARGLSTQVRDAIDKTLAAVPARGAEVRP